MAANAEKPAGAGVAAAAGAAAAALREGELPYAHLAHTEARLGRLEDWLRLSQCAKFGPAGQRFVRQRPWFMAVMVAVNLWAYRQGGLSDTRLVFLLAMVTLPFSIALISALHPRFRQLTASALWYWLACGQICIASAIVATGGMRSPLAPMLAIPIITIVTVWGLSVPARVLIGTFVINTIAIALLPVSITGEGIASPYHEFLTALNLLFGVGFGCRAVVDLSEGFSSKSRVLESVREQALAAAAGRIRSLEQVGSKVAHELKNPLAAIKSLLQLEGGNARDERSSKRLEVMTREVARMEGILREYLSFSRPLEDLRVGAVDLATVADNVLALLEGRAAAASVRLERTGPSVLLAGDARRLEEAVLNLVANALEATRAAGNVRVEIAAEKDGAVLRVRDSGAGMTPAVLEKLGTPFFTTRRDGNGLGVVLARAVIAQHGGALEFSSRPGEGTVATVKLPYALPIGALSGGQVHGTRAAG